MLSPLNKTTTKGRVKLTGGTDVGVFVTIITEELPQCPSQEKIV